MLQEELEERGLAGRVTLANSLNDASLAVAAAFAEAVEEDLHSIQSRLALGTLTEFVKTEVLDDLAAVTVDPIALALPVRAQSPVLSALGDIEKSDFEVKAALEGDETAVEVTLVIDTGVLVESSPTADLGEDFVEIAEGDGVRISETSKSLRFTALVTVDRYYRPTAGELTSVRALEDDPGHTVWRAAVRRRSADEFRVLCTRCG